MARRRRFSTDLKLAVVVEMQPGTSISYVARRDGLSQPGVPLEAADERRGREAVRADGEVVPAAELRRLEELVRDLERLLGRKTMENEILSRPGLGRSAGGKKSNFTIESYSVGGAIGINCMLAPIK